MNAHRMSILALVVPAVHDERTGRAKAQAAIATVAARRDVVGTDVYPRPPEDPEGRDIGRPQKVDRAVAACTAGISKYLVDSDTAVCKEGSLSPLEGGRLHDEDSMSLVLAVANSPLMDILAVKDIHLLLVAVFYCLPRRNRENYRLANRLGGLGLVLARGECPCWIRCWLLECLHIDLVAWATASAL